MLSAAQKARKAKQSRWIWILAAIGEMRWRQIGKGAGTQLTRLLDRKKMSRENEEVGQIF